MVLARRPSGTQRSNHGDTEDQSAVNPDTIDASDLSRPTSWRRFRLDVPRPRLDIKWGIRKLIGYLRSDIHSGTRCDDQSTSIVVRLPSPREGTTVYNLCRFVRNFFETYSNEGDSMDTKERRRRMRGCVETAASLVCCTEVELGLFGEVGEVLSATGRQRTDKRSVDDQIEPIVYRALDMPLARGHPEDGRRRQATGTSEVRTGRNCTLTARL